VGGTNHGNLWLLKHPNGTINMTTATLKNITKENDNVSFYVQYSNGEERNYRFPIENYQLSLLADQVKAEILKFDSLDAKFAPIQALVGKTFQLTKGTLMEVK
jgi:hypothetical protein